MTRQAALLLALSALATAAALVSFGSWILRRRGRPDREGTSGDRGGEAADGSGWIVD